MHNNDCLNNIEKFQYLKSCLHRDAVFIAANYQLKDDLHELAYKALHDRYHNQRRLAQLYIDRILDFLKKTSSRKLRSFLTPQLSSKIQANLVTWVRFITNSTKMSTEH